MRQPTTDVVPLDQVDATSVGRLLAAAAGDLRALDPAVAGGAWVIGGTVDAVGGREYLGCTGALAVGALLSGVGVATVLGTWISLFIGPIIVIVGAVVVFAIVSARRS